jgi:hypothetical protein
MTVPDTEAFIKKRRRYTAGSCPRPVPTASSASFLGDLKGTHYVSMILRRARFSLSEQPAVYWKQIRLDHSGDVGEEIDMSAHPT